MTIRHEVHLTDNGDIMLVVHRGHRAGVAELRFDRSAPMGHRWRVTNCFLHRPMTRQERHHLSEARCPYTGHPNCYVAHWQALEGVAQDNLNVSMETLINYLYYPCEVA